RPSMPDGPATLLSADGNPGPPEPGKWPDTPATCERPVRNAIHLQPGRRHDEIPTEAQAATAGGTPQLSHPAPSLRPRRRPRPPTSSPSPSGRPKTDYFVGPEKSPVVPLGQRRWPLLCYSSSSLTLSHFCKTPSSRA